MIVMGHLQAIQTQNNRVERKNQKFALFRRLYEQELEKQNIIEIFNIPDWMLTLPRDLALEFWQQVREYESALAAYNESINILPEYPEAWYWRGNALGTLELHPEALASFEQAVRIQPNYYQAWYNRSIALYKLERYTEAIASFEQAIKIQPDYAQAWFKRGVTLNDLQRYSEAMASFNQALQLQPYPPSRGIIIGDLSPNSVKKPVTKPDFDIILYSKACCYAQQGDTDQALANLRQAIAQQPEKYREMSKIDPYFDSLREDVYFQSLVREGR